MFKKRLALISLILFVWGGWGMGSYATDFGTQYSSYNCWFTEWSPDGQWIAFISTTGVANSSVYIIPSNGGTPVLVKSFPDKIAMDPVFTSDSKEIYFQTGDSQSHQWIEKVNINTLQSSVVVENCGPAYLSRDGKYFAYRDDAINKLSLIDLSTSSKTNIYDTNTNRPSFGYFSPDSKFIVTTFQNSTTGNKLFKLPLDGGVPEQLVFDDHQQWYPKYSPDGKWINYTDLSTSKIMLSIRRQTKL